MRFREFVIYVSEILLRAERDQKIKKLEDMKKELEEMGDVSGNYTR